MTPQQGMPKGPVEDVARPQGIPGSQCSSVPSPVASCTVLLTALAMTLLSTPAQTSRRCHHATLRATMVTCPSQCWQTYCTWTDRSMSCCAADAEDMQYALNCNIESLLVLMSLNMLSSLLVNCACAENTVSNACSLLTHLQTQEQKTMPRA
jgi:hypothetical protein